MPKYNIIPVAKPRQTHSDRWRKRPAVLRYRAFKDHVRLLHIDVPRDGCMITFGLQMPKSWSERDKAALVGKPHETKPDVDNLIKALLDACYSDDAGVHTIAARKVWAAEGFIDIQPWPNRSRRPVHRLAK